MSPQPVFFYCSGHSGNSTKPLQHRYVSSNRIFPNLQTTRTDLELLNLPSVCWLVDDDMAQLVEVRRPCAAGVLSCGRGCRRWWRSCSKGRRRCSVAAAAFPPLHALGFRSGTGVCGVRRCGERWFVCQPLTPFYVARVEGGRNQFGCCTPDQGA